MTQRSADRVAELLSSEGPLAERYAIVGTLDGSTNSSRWRAEDRLTGKPVVVVATSGPVEAEVAAAMGQRLDMLRDAPHANVAEVVEWGEFEGVVWAVENLVAQGETLAEMLERKGRLTIQELTPIVAQLLKAYGHAHSRGLAVGPFSLDQVHLVERAKRLNFVRIEAFAWLNPLLAGQARDGVYTAPEDPVGVATRVEGDVFIVGRMIFELLAGTALDMERVGPTGDDQACSIDGDMLVELVPESEGVPPAFYELVGRALARSPDDRPADANALVEELIDTLPMSMFRLPSRTAGIPGERAGESSAGHSMVLTGSWLVAAQKQAARTDHPTDPSGHPIEASAEDLSASASAQIAALTASQSIAAAESGANARGGGGQGHGMSSALMAAGAVALVGMVGLGIFFLAQPNATSASNDEAEAEDVSAAAAAPVAGRPAPATAQHAPPTPDAGEAASAVEETDVAPIEVLPGETPSPSSGEVAATKAPRSKRHSGQGTPKQRAGKAGSAAASAADAGTKSGSGAGALAGEGGTAKSGTSGTSAKKSTSSGLLGADGASTNTKPSTKSSDAFLPPTGQ